MNSGKIHEIMYFGRFITSFSKQEHKSPKSTNSWIKVNETSSLKRYQILINMWLPKCITITSWTVCCTVMMAKTKTNFDNFVEEGQFFLSISTTICKSNTYIRLIAWFFMFITTFNTYIRIRVYITPVKLNIELKVIKYIPNSCTVGIYQL